jgi:hypothetical protein
LRSDASPPAQSSGVVPWMPSRRSVRAPRSKHVDEPDAADRPLRLRRLERAPERGPGAVAVLAREHVLRVREQEALPRALAEDVLGALDRLGLAGADGAHERLRLRAVVLDVESSGKLVVHDDPLHPSASSGRKRLVQH